VGDREAVERVPGCAGRPNRKEIVAPTLRSARRRATGILPVLEHGQDGHGTPVSADLKVSATKAGA